MTTPGGGSAGGSGDLGTVRGKIVIDASEAKKGSEAAAASVDDFRKKSEESNSKMAASAVKFAKGYSVAVAGGIGLAINAAKNFEQSLANVSAAGGKDAANQMDKIREKALQLGADTKFSATEAANAMEELVKAGLSVQEVLNGAADAAVNLAAAEGITIPEAAKIAATAMTAFNLKAGDMPGIANKISQAASSTKMDVNDFSFAMNQAGAVSKLVGLSFDDMTLAITAMGKSGIIGSDAGTSLKTMLMNLQPTTKKAYNTMHDLGIITKDGANQFFDAGGKIKSMADMAEVLHKGLSKLNPAQKQAALEAMFGSDAIRAGAIISEQGAAGMNKLTTEMQNQLTVAEKAKVKQDTLAGALEKMKGSIETAAIKLGDVFIPVIRKAAEFVEKLADWFGNLPGPVKEAVGWVLAGTAALAGIAFIASPIVKAFGMIGAAWSLLSKLFMSNPWVAIITALIILVIAIVKNWDFIVGWLSDRWHWIADLATTVWNAIWKFFSDRITDVVDFVVGVWNGIGKFFSDKWEEIATNSRIIWEGVARFFSTLWTNVTGAIVEAWNAVGRFFRDLWNDIWKDTSDRWTVALNWFKNLGPNIMSALGNFGRLLYNIGGDLIRGLWQGIQDLLKWLWDGIKNIGSSIASAFKSILGIHSPSKVMAEIGMDTTLGLGVGMLSKLNELQKAVNTVGSVIAPTLTPYSSPAASVMGTAVLDRATTGAQVQAAQASRGGNTIVIEKLEIPINAKLDPTNALEWRKAMVAIKDGLAQVEKEYR